MPALLSGQHSSPRSSSSAPRACSGRYREARGDDARFQVSGKELCRGRVQEHPIKYLVSFPGVPISLGSWDRF